MKKSISSWAIELFRILTEEIYQLLSYWAIENSDWRFLPAIELLSYWEIWLKISTSYWAVELLRFVSEEIHQLLSYWVIENSDWWFVPAIELLSYWEFNFLEVFKKGIPPLLIRQMSVFIDYGRIKAHLSETFYLVTFYLNYLVPMMIFPIFIGDNRWHFTDTFSQINQSIKTVLLL